MKRKLRLVQTLCAVALWVWAQTYSFKRGIGVRTVWMGVFVIFSDLLVLGWLLHSAYARWRESA